MHIADGVLAAPVLIGGGIAAAGGVAAGLRALRPEKIMETALLSAAFFVASLLHIQVGVWNTHLILNGLLGAVLGWAALPAVFTALFFQALLFQYGGLAVLGANTCIMAFPALCCGLLFRPWFSSPRYGLAAAFCCGAFSVGASAALAAGALALSGERFMGTAVALLLAHIPIMLAEGIITALVVRFLVRARPELLHTGQNKKGPA